MASAKAALPFERDQTLLLTSDADGYQGHLIHARIRDILPRNPQTVDLAVDILGLHSQPSPSVPNPVVLKLHDRRFSSAIREKWYAKAWSEETEKEHVQLVLSGKPQEFLAWLERNPAWLVDLILENHDYTNGQVEAQLVQTAASNYDMEGKVYEKLLELQGKTIPRLLERVRLKISPDDATSDQADRIDVMGSIVERIDGFSLRNLPKETTRLDWHEIVGQAIRLVNTIGRLGIIIHDIDPSMFVVSRNDPDKAGHPGSTNGRFRVWMTDLSEARVRGEGASDLEWYTAKAKTSEDVSLGKQMESILQSAAPWYKLTYSSEGTSYFSMMAKKVEGGVSQKRRGFKRCKRVHLYSR